MFTLFYAGAPFFFIVLGGGGGYKNSGTYMYFIEIKHLS